MKGTYFWKEWEGLLPPFLWKCGRCCREFTDEEYEHLPEVSLSSGDHLHKCRSCGYLFGVETWKMESLAKVKVPESEFETKISTQFLEAIYQGFSYETRVGSFRIPRGGHVSSLFMMPAQTKKEAIRNHLGVCRMLRSGYFGIDPPDFDHPQITVRLKYVGKRWVPAYAVVEQPKRAKPKGPQLFKILQNSGFIYIAAETPEQLVNKITDQFYRGAIKPGSTIRNQKGEPVCYHVYIYHEDGHFTVTIPHSEGPR